MSLWPCLISEVGRVNFRSLQPTRIIPFASSTAHTQLPKHFWLQMHVRNLSQPLLRPLRSAMSRANTAYSVLPDQLLTRSLEWSLRSKKHCITAFTNFVIADTEELLIKYRSHLRYPHE